MNYPKRKRFSYVKAVVLILDLIYYRNRIALK